ncbi:IclR family transcriptional regulator [Paenibacillus sp. J2TS4]|uniref:IclR family transcriptional regulator n=1 Tax=Paenibacillus sp. J2TS4 TaxID=2807194 RepID=UPI001B0D9442|nr:IclR family transcriptional regulator [Paenibacillus sp. J2TS4]GIP34732.1 transcriptional regulator [Paenibacillus sp. J2TS4]
MEDNKLTVRAVERAVDILLCFTDASDLSLTEISSKVGLHKSTVHRLIASLEGKGFLVRHAGTDKYRLGLRIWELAAGMAQTDDPAVLLLPEMERLRDLLGETVSLYVRDGFERVRIQAVQSNQAIRRVAQVGARLPLYVGASSKILVAFADRETRNELKQSRDWPNGPERERFLEQILEVQQLGYATSVEEREEGAAAIAAPIFSRSHKLVAALAVSGPANRLTMEQMKQDAPIIVEAANRMGKMIK